MPNWQTWTVADVVRWLIEHGQRSMFDPTIISLLRHTLALGPQGVKLKTIYADVFACSRRQVFSAMIRRVPVNGNQTALTQSYSKI